MRYTPRIPLHHQLCPVLLCHDALRDVPHDDSLRFGTPELQLSSYNRPIRWPHVHPISLDTAQSNTSARQYRLYALRELKVEQAVVQRAAFREDRIHIGRS